MEHEVGRLYLEIERVRQMLTRKCEAGELGSSDVLALSQHLDNLINMHYRMAEPAKAV